MNECQEYIQDIMYRVPVLTKDQLVQWLYLEYGVHTKQADASVRSAGKTGRLLISTNGYVTTKQYLTMVCNDDPEKLSMNEYSWHRLGNISIKREYLDLIDCFWVVLAMLPDSEGFQISGDLFQIQFTSADRKTFYQVIKMDMRNEVTSALPVKCLPYPSAEWIGKMKRIAIVNTPSQAALVPHLGFTHICMIDPEEHSRIRMLEKRKTEIWKESDRLS